MTTNKVHVGDELKRQIRQVIANSGQSELGYLSNIDYKLQATINQKGDNSYLRMEVILIPKETSPDSFEEYKPYTRGHPILNRELAKIKAMMPLLSALSVKDLNISNSKSNTYFLHVPIDSTTLGVKNLYSLAIMMEHAKKGNLDTEHYHVKIIQEIFEYTDTNKFRYIPLNDAKEFTSTFKSLKTQIVNQPCGHLDNIDLTELQKDFRHGMEEHFKASVAWATNPKNSYLINQYYPMYVYGNNPAHLVYNTIREQLCGNYMRVSAMMSINGSSKGVYTFTDGDGTLYDRRTIYKTYLYDYLEGLYGEPELN